MRIRKMITSRSSSKITSGQLLRPGSCSCSCS